MKSNIGRFLINGLMLLFWLVGCIPATPTAPPLQVSTIPLALAPPDWFVSPTGNDANDCQSAATPCAHVATALERAADDDTIHLAAGIYTENLDIKKSITIVGEGLSTTSIDGVAGAEKNVIDIGNDIGQGPVPPMVPSNLNVTFRDFSIRHGDATNIYKIPFGGGIYMTEGTLTLTRVEFFQNVARLGGGMFICTWCEVTGFSVNFRGNQSIGTDGQNAGGGIYNGGTLTLQDSLVEMSTSERDGAGIYNTNQVTLIRVQMIHNIAARLGGGLYSGINATLVDVDFQSNQAMYGGAILNIGSSMGTDPGVFGTMLIKRSDFYGNTASIAGGAIANVKGSVLTLVNDTFTGNESQSQGGAIANGTSADMPSLEQSDVNFHPAVLNAYNVTIAYSKGAGVYNMDNGQANFINALFAENAGGSCIGAVTGNGNMLTDSSCAFDGPKNFYNAVPLIEGAPHPNGGVTFSHALLDGSPAIDAGVPGPDPIPAEDQRGNHRPTDGDGNGIAWIDIGAYEADAGTSSVNLEPVFTPNINTNCRKGPGLNYEVSTNGIAGSSYPIVGKSQDGFWHYVQFNPSLRCWMSVNTGTAQGDLSGLPEIPAPLVVPNQTWVCSDFTNKTDCTSHSGCLWFSISDLFPPFCTNR